MNTGNDMVEEILNEIVRKCDRALRKNIQPKLAIYVDCDCMLKLWSSTHMCLEIDIDDPRKVTISGYPVYTVENAGHGWRVVLI